MAYRYNTLESYAFTFGFHGFDPDNDGLACED
jgi:hypothetical protein